MMKFLRLASLGLILLGARPGLGQNAAPPQTPDQMAAGKVAAHYLAPDSIDLRAALGNPPAPGTPENDRDLAAVLARQKERTAAEIARVQKEEKLDPSAFEGVLGSGFTAEKMPATFALLRKATDDAHAIAEQGKNLWQRKRPPLQDPAVHPAVKVPETASYPSFHAARGALWAAILARLAPDLRERILARGEEIGEDRVIAGVHFPTDVAAERKLGRLVAERLLRSRDFSGTSRRRRRSGAGGRFEEAWRISREAG